MNRQTDIKFIQLLILPITVAVIAVVVLVIAISATLSAKVKPVKPRPEGESVKTEITITGSHSPGYYPGEFDFSMACSDESCRILYTMTSPARKATNPDEKTASTGEVYLYAGGKLPSAESVNESGVRQSIVYTGDIKIPGKSLSSIETSRMTVIVAAAFDGDKRVSDYYYYTFIVDRKGKEPNYQDKFGSYLVSITVDEESLYGHEQGIFILGKAYLDELRNNPGREVDNWFPRNYNQRGTAWEREARIQIFDGNGNMIVNQDAGIRIAGGMSRHNAVKSLRLVARSVYDEDNPKIIYEFFNNTRDLYGNKIKTFDKLIIRNSANDFGGLMFKDLFLHKLGGHAGLDYQDGIPCVVYINGKYYSIMNIRESLDGDYIESHYKIPKEAVTMVSIASGTGFTFTYKLTSGAEEGLNEFKRDMRKLISTNYANRDISEIEEIIDVDNYIEYMAYQMYISNMDWPHNNVLAWKYVGDPNGSIYGMDGKWRFILKDLDLSSSFTNTQFNAYESVLNSGMSNGDPSIGQVFRSCIKNKEFAARFKGYMKKLCNEYITKETVNALMDSLLAEREKDMVQFWNYYGGNRVNWINLANEHRNFIKARSKFMLNNLERYI